MEKYGKKKRFVHEHVEFLPYDSENPPQNHRPKYAKPYRKRHLGLLITCILLFIFASALLGVRIIRSNQLQQQVLQQASNLQTTGTLSFDSTLGYRLVYNPTVFEAEASVAHDNGEATTYTGEDLAQPRAYQKLQLTPLRDDLGREVRYDTSVFQVMYDQTPIDPSADLEQVANAYAPTSDAYFDVTMLTKERVTINGQEFSKATYQKTPKFNAQAAETPLRTIVYVGNDYGQPLVMTIAGVSEFTPLALYDEVIQSVVMEDPNAVVLGATVYKPDVLANWFSPIRGWLRNLLGTEETPEQKRAKTIATYMPAVVKVYHVICGELTIRASSLGYDCLNTTGSGFLISEDGYVATSGHVVSVSAKDVIVDTLRTNPETLPSVLRLLGYSNYEVGQIVDATNSNPEAILSVMQQIYKLPDEVIRFNGQKDYYGVALGRDQLTLLNEDSKSQLDIKETTTTKKATLVAVDYNSADLVNDTFTGSDVALLKLQGSNYPVVRLGESALLTQGMPITVLGYPALAENELTDNSTISATTTNGVVSALRNSNDGQHRVIQTDADISGGNSGGPAFDEHGAVFGIATYIYQSADGGALSYMRDIADLGKLAQKSNLTLNTASKTQELWESALDDFYAARYRSALTKISQVQSLYPPHSLADTYKAMAESHIAAGEDTSNQTALYVLGAIAATSLVGMMTMIIIIVRHNHYHRQYKTLNQPPKH